MLFKWWLRIFGWVRFGFFDGMKEIILKNVDIFLLVFEVFLKLFFLGFLIILSF